MDHLSQIQQKIFQIKPLQQRIATWRLKSDRIVFTNGCFDILHAGHIHTLAAARDHGDKLIVGLNSDTSVQRLKGPDRPVNHQDDRALLIASLHVVDAVICFEEDTPQSLIQSLMPDVLVKGGDYTIDQIAGADIVKAHGGEVIVVPLLEGRSTTGMLNRLRPS